MEAVADTPARALLGESAGAQLVVVGKRSRRLQSSEGERDPRPVGSVRRRAGEHVVDSR
jgi:hypothetical protein